MRPSHPFEEQFGMEVYSTDWGGTGGRIKRKNEDFIVEEIAPNGRVLEVDIELAHQRNDFTIVQEISGNRDNFVVFKMQKMGLSTLDVASIMGAELSLPRNRIYYAGLKDKRAITAQRMSIPAESAERIADIHLSRIWLSDFEYQHNPINIGDLWGNRFSIILREMEVSCDEAARLTTNLKDSHILNYFGVQRFGVTRPNTHLVGRALVKDDYEEAIRIMLTSSSQYDPPELTNLRMQLSEDLKFTESLLDQIPEKFRHERIVVDELIRHPDDFRRAIRRISPRIQTLFVHSYQSYLFNRLISRRAKTGLPISEPVPGDFLIELDQAHSGRDSWLYVTEKNLEDRLELVNTRRYGLAAPVPGYSTKMPPTAQSEQLRNLLNEEGVALRDFRKKDTRPLDSPGGLHLIPMYIQDLKTTCIGEDLQLQFSLRKGSYATVLLREIMKNHPINRV